MAEPDRNLEFHGRMDAAAARPRTTDAMTVPCSLLAAAAAVVLMPQKAMSPKPKEGKKGGKMPTETAAAATVVKTATHTAAEINFETVIVAAKDDADSSAQPPNVVVSFDGRH